VKSSEVRASFRAVLSAAAFAAFLSPALAVPALWHVRGPKGELYLFGSIHLLPRDLEWQKCSLAEAIDRADVFVFEIPLGSPTTEKIRALVIREGRLRKDESLHAMLSASGRADLDADAALAGLNPQALDKLRPWLVELALVTSRMATENATPANGADEVLTREAETRHRDIRYLETLDAQLALIVPSDRRLELAEFEASLKEFRTEHDAYPDMLRAWLSGDVAKLEFYLNGEFKDDAKLRKTVLDDRNRAWFPRLLAMLREKKTFFVTVGAGQLVGTNSLPDLLRGAGFSVECP